MREFLQKHGAENFASSEAESNAPTIERAEIAVALVKARKWPGMNGIN